MRLKFAGQAGVMAAMIALLPACSSNPESVVANGLQDNGAIRVQQELVNLVFARGACFGNCPVFRAEWSSSGNYRFTGPAVPTALLATLEPETMNQLQSLYLEVDALDLPENLQGAGLCPRFLTDMPTVTISWQSNNRRWQLKHNLGCKGFAGEQQLLVLESRIEALLPKPAMQSEK